MIKINITLEIEKEELNTLEDVLRNRYNVIDLSILPDTKELYNNDPIFKKLVKAVRDAQRVKNDYINEHNV